MQASTDELRHSSADSATSQVPSVSEPDTLLRAAVSHFDRGDFQHAVGLYHQVLAGQSRNETLAQACNDLAVLDCLSGNLDSARAMFRRAIELDTACEAARTNLALLDAPSDNGSAHVPNGTDSATTPNAVPADDASL